MHKTARTVAMAAIILLTASCKEPGKIKAFPESFLGVGLELKMHGEGAEVVKVLADGPAENSGMKAGDIITAIDGTETAGLSLESLIEKLRGPVDSQVAIRTRRQGEQTAQIFILKRTYFKKGPGGIYNTKR